MEMVWGSEVRCTLSLTSKISSAVQRSSSMPGLLPMHAAPLQHLFGHVPAVWCCETALNLRSLLHAPLMCLQTFPTASNFMIQCVHTQALECKPKTFTRTKFATLLRCRTIAFIGDSVMRNLAMALIRSVRPTPNWRHTDRHLSTPGGTQFDVFWHSRVC